jgi:hypothetical protein
LGGGGGRALVVDCDGFLELLLDEGSDVGVSSAASFFSLSEDFSRFRPLPDSEEGETDRARGEVCWLGSERPLGNDAGVRDVLSMESFLLLRILPHFRSILPEGIGTGLGSGVCWGSKLGGGLEKSGINCSVHVVMVLAGVYMFVLLLAFCA